MQTLYCPRNLVWLRLLGPTRGVLGFTRAGVERIGSVVGAERVAGVGEAAAPGTALLTLSWEGYTRSAADELYHSVWEDIEGTADLIAPIPCTVTKFNDLEALLDQQGPLHDEDTWLCEAEFDTDAPENARLLDEHSYEKWEDGLREKGESAKRSTPTKKLVKTSAARGTSMTSRWSK